MERLNRMVIDLYKQSFTNYVNGSTVDIDAIMVAQESLSNAITKARIENTGTELLEQLKADIDYLKYSIL